MAHDKFTHEAETVIRRYDVDPLPAAVRSEAHVRWSDGQGDHARVLVTRTIIGSAGRADLVVADPTASRIHAELDLRPEGVWLRDLGSRNGTFLEGLRVREAMVPSGGRIRVGSTTLVLDAKPSPTPPTLWPEPYFGPLVGSSAVMRELYAQLHHIARTDSSILVSGETGTGKELVARAIHEASPRAAQPFVVVDCAALPDNLLEAELFGHERGAFTGAHTARKGAFEAADGGTLFLDEIGELPLAMQPKLLRVLESRTVRRLGENQHRRVDFRLVSATHRDLRTMVNAGGFREDLYFRLAVLPISLPPLRDRPGDIPALVERMLGPGHEVGRAVLAELAARPWLGNVRELRNVVERIAAFGADRALALDVRASQPSLEPSSVRSQHLATPAVVEAPSASAGAFVPAVAIEGTLREFRERWHLAGDREYLRRLLERHGGNVAAAAREAGVDRTYLYRVIRELR